MSFQAVQDKIAAKEGVSEKAAGAILAKSTRNASPAAKKANPNLKKVKGKSKPSGMSPVAAKIGNAMMGSKC
jgi:hypothetical protein